MKPSLRGHAFEFGLYLLKVMIYDTADPQLFAGFHVHHCVIDKNALLCI